MDPQNAEPAVASLAPLPAVHLWVLLAFLVFWAISAYVLNKRGFFLRGVMPALTFGALFIATIYVAYVWSSQQSLVLLLVPMIVWIFNEFLLRRSKNLKEVVFVSKIGLKYGDLFHEKLSALIKNSQLELTRVLITDDNGQTTAMTTAVERNPLAIVIVPTDRDITTVQNVKSAYQAHIPCVIIDKKIDDRTFERAGITPPAYVGSDFEKGGSFAAEALDAAIGGHGNIAIIAGPRDSAPSQARLRAFAVKMLERAPAIQIVYCTYCLSWESDEGESATMRCIRQLKEASIGLDGIFCCNDTIALGALDALTSVYKRRLLPGNSVRVVGYDGLPEMIECIQTNRADATVDVQISAQATATHGEIMKVQKGIRDHIVYTQASHVNPVRIVRSKEKGDISYEDLSAPRPLTEVVRRKMYKAVFFDMDGLMIDNEGAQLRSFNAVLEPYGVFLSEKDFVKFVGVSQREIFHILRETRGDIPDIEELMRRKREVYFPILEREFQPARGLGSLIRYLQRQEVFLGVVSSSPLLDIKKIMKDLGFPTWDLILSSLDVKRAKPFADVYVKAACDLDVSPQDCVAFEDSDKGIQAARSAQMDCFVVPNKFTLNQDLSNATRSFNSLSEAEHWFRNNISFHGRDH